MKLKDLESNIVYKCCKRGNYFKVGDLIVSSSKIIFHYNTDLILQDKYLLSDIKDTDKEEFRISDKYIFMNDKVYRK